MNLSKKEILKYYSRKEIQEEIIEHAKNKEIAIKYDYGFGKRPDTLQYPNDIVELVKKGATSFHCSEELWKNPLQLSPSMKKKDLDELRIGWDLIIDIDCPVLEYSKIAADLVIKALKHHSISSISCKFSGNKGFHIGVPFEAFPEKVHGKEIRLLFPEGPRKIAFYLEEMIKEHLEKGILRLNSIEEIMKKTNKKYNELVKNGRFDPFSILEIDTLLISQRHLYRMPYCFNEKSGLISCVINPNKVLKFEKFVAKPENVIVSRFKFLDRNAKKNEARTLMREAFDFCLKKQEEREEKEFQTIKKAIPLEFFPPCIKNILLGLRDGRKRAVFVLINFLTTLGWDYKKIKTLLKEWNKKNDEPLRENYILSQLNYHKKKRKRILPPNCSNVLYYKDIGVCKPDNTCKKIKNPVNYAIIKTRYINEKIEKKRKK